MDLLVNPEIPSVVIKLVVIGPSGVGKTSLRGKYISGRFSTGYRATIGADFITKTLPHPIHPNQSVTLQIWDTAGQERFSGLSSAFFRGADAALLMFDVNQPQTMEVLTKWWDEFKDKAPLAEEDVEDYCCVVVGNKVDVVGTSTEGPRGRGPISETEALTFLDKLIPPSTRPVSPIALQVEEASDEDDSDNTLASSQVTVRPRTSHVEFSSPLVRTSSSSTNTSLSQSTSPPEPITITPNPPHSPSKRHLTKSRSRSSSRFSIYGSTMTSTHTTLSVYHTPSSSIYDVYQSARSSPEPWTTPSASSSYRDRTPRRVSSTSSDDSASSAATITPSLFATTSSTNTATTTPAQSPPNPIPIPARGPKLFFTSAKTGQGVSDVFEYIARRVVERWDYQERVEARRMHMQETSTADTIRLGLDNEHGQRYHRKWGNCCAS